MADDDDSAELEADFQLRDQLIKASEFLRHRGQPSLGSLVLSLLVPDCISEATSELDEEEELMDDDFSGDPTLFDEFDHTIRTHLLSLREAGYDDDEYIPEVILPMVLQATQRAASRLLQPYDIYDTTVQKIFRNAGGLALEKQTFRAAAGDEKKESVAEGDRRCGGSTECSICFEEFVDGVQLSVMPCPSSSRGHRFHSDCIAKWLEISNTCPLCRHQMPAYF